MKRFMLALCLVFTLATSQAKAVVFINEVFINPPGSGSDDTREFIELMGTPGKKLDGYALAFCSGTEDKYFMLNSIPPLPNPAPEIDEFMSLDGLTLGANGILVVGTSSRFYFPQLLEDSNFASWDDVWNGGLDTPGKLENDGSNTILLIRNRPGRTEADPNNSVGLRWGKDVQIDEELVTPIEDMVCAGDTFVPGLSCKTANDCIGSGSTCVPGFVDQYGDGNIDKGEPNGLGGYTQDLKGVTTPDDVSDDLEIVDELSYENARGWEYDMDDRDVDLGSTDNSLPQRNVHTLDDPQGLNPDVLVRVDYRTKGEGWTPAAGATGEGPNGNNWQDTATEQWIRGESTEGTSGVGGYPHYFLDNSANSNSDAIQPYLTQTPLWLDDGIAPDYNFNATMTYQIMAGRVNPLATTFIPGDADRDGDVDQEDIDKITAVFGDDDWIFSNSFEAAEQSDDGDPATQTRPWDVDATGTNGIEPADLQWTLNFVGDTTGRVVGVTYDDTVASVSGVVLNPNTDTACTVTVSSYVASGRMLNDLRFGDVIELTVSGQVTSGAIGTADEQNGIMQYVHDLVIANGGVLQVLSVEPASNFTVTRQEIQQLQGINGDMGVVNINGYTTSFGEGVASADELYQITLRVVGAGTTSVTVEPASEEKFAKSTPHGLKIGHTDNNGDPADSAYPAAITIVGSDAGDANGDGTVLTSDFVDFPSCMSGPNTDATSACLVFDFDLDGDVDASDYASFQAAIQ